MSKKRKEKIINGLKYFKKSCGKIPIGDCAEKCLYKDICDLIFGDTPDEWDFKSLKADKK